MVIHYNHTDFFWVLYTIAGVAVPLAVLQLYRATKARLEARKGRSMAAEALPDDEA